MIKFFPIYFKDNKLNLIFVFAQVNYVLFVGGGSESEKFIPIASWHIYETLLPKNDLM
ncbi:MAG: hypothetical protein ACTHKF_03515 [Candidatus Nitrosocosmicus sp.]